MIKINSKLKKALIQIALVVVVLAGGVKLAKKLVTSKKPPARKEIKQLAPLLTASIVHAEDIQITIKGYGTVKPKAEVKVIPQVSGKVIACHPNFVNGGFFKAGQALITIESDDYRFAVEAAQAAVARDQVRLDTELAEAVVAKQEWADINPDKEPTSPLVLREPQIKDAKAQLQASNAKLATAELNLKRTVISMPFDGRIAEETGDIGQYLMAGQSVATVYSTESVEIVVPLEDHELQWFKVPMGYVSGKASKDDLTRAVVTADFAGKTHTWSAVIARTEGTIDPASRMVNVVAEVKDPFKISNGRPPLVPGMFVEVNIAGKVMKNTIRIPRHAVRNGNQVWTAVDDTLNIQQIQIARNDKEYAYVTSGLDDGAVIITSALDTATAGMKIRTQLAEETEKAHSND
ncbi:MAG TPA: efflux RND transporter periplasmic adaptor subunit [Phycisphaerales bacterium]|nr:efflux RND transporter periplasmic adaptor subunit [Phycisphaerales bacterium]